MDSEFSRQRLVENISTLMQQQKLKVGEVEQRIGISTGYLSKMLKKDTVSAPSADTIWKLAKVFGVSTDMLIEGDFSGSNENIQYLRSFFSKLKSKTISDEIEWEAITIDDVNRELMSVNPDLPIIQIMPSDSGKKAELHRYFEGREISASIHRDRRIYSSGVSVQSAWVEGTGYKATIKGGIHIYIFQMGCSFNIGEGLPSQEVSYFDVYFGGMERPNVEPIDLAIPPEEYDYVYQPVCNTFGNAHELEPLIRELYRSIESNNGDVRISWKVRNTIDYFMDDSKEDLPFM